MGAGCGVDAAPRSSWFYSDWDEDMNGDVADAHLAGTVCARFAPRPPGGAAPICEVLEDSVTGPEFVDGHHRASVLAHDAPVAALAEAWERLPEPRSAPSITGGPRFFQAWRQTLGGRAQPWVIALHHRGRLVGVVPLAYSRRGIAAGGRQLALAGSRRPPLTDMADARVEPGHEIALGRAVVGLLERHAGSWDSLYLGSVAAQSQTYSAVLGAIEERGWAWSSRSRTAMVLDTAGDWAAFRAGLGRSTKRLPQRLKRLAAQGKVRVALDLVGAPGARALDQLIDLYRHRWGSGSWLEDPAYRSFLRRVWLAHSHDQARLSGLWVDDQMVAGHLVFRQGDRDQSLLVAARHDGPYARESPGRVLDYLVAERAFGSPTREIHLLHTVLPTKLVWTSRFLPELTLIALSPQAGRLATVALPLAEAAIVGRAAMARRRRP